jgi:hypothetical protein
MAVTVKVSGVANSLVHKGSNGISAATIPDVCKTPSPGGPVPIPYPNVSQTTSLSKGTTTVKADGGMMIAIKGSEFSLSNGDNPGTLGGVKSSTFMKESTWILYSFDVKMDGKNACRLGDKKFQNHENAADLGGEVQLPNNVLVFDLGIDCEAKKADKRPGKAWDACMVQELCDMVTGFNAVPKDKIKRVSPSPSSSSSPDFATYNSVKDKFASNFAALVNEPASPANEQKIRDSFGSQCRYDAWAEGRPPPARNPDPPRSGTTGLNPDHVHDVGLGGPFKDAGAMKWVNGRVNTTCGAAMKNYDANKKLKVTSACCT